ncbi:O-antigen ligase family protein [Methylobacterium sp. Leaf113]|uniref:O-antigen ligase family protein n=1 Tax=Methylobacterium sp. Leaf113 TaxID=1736259 RepID=UPI0012E8A4ED|nr:O-antigen ligase family protein [Methylobacterium sp. Leaf113]
MAQGISLIDRCARSNNVIRREHCRRRSEILRIVQSKGSLDTGRGAQRYEPRRSWEFAGLMSMSVAAKEGTGVTQPTHAQSYRNTAQKTSVFSWLFAALCLNGMIYNEVIGSAFLYLLFIVMIVIVAAYPTAFLREFESQKAILLLLPAYALLSTLWSAVPESTARTALQAVLMIAFGVMLCRLVPAKQFVHIMFLSLILAILLGFIVNRRVLDSMTNEINWSGIYYNKNSMSMIGALFGLCCAHHAMDSKRFVPIRLFYLAILPLSYVVCYSAKSIAMIVILTIGLGLMTSIYLAFLLPRRMFRSTIEQISIVIVIFSGVGFFVLSNFSGELLQLVGKSPTLTGRTVLWDWASKIIPTKFWLGWGYNGFWVQGNPLAEMLWLENHVQSRMGFHFHNLFYQSQIDLGLFGLLIVATMLSWTFLMCYRWVYYSANITSVFYFSCATVMIVSQYQDIQLFGGFGTMSLLFTIAGVYAYDFNAMERSRSSRKGNVQSSRVGGALVGSTQVPEGTTQVSRGY